MTQEYYQLGGFRPHIQWFQETYDDKKLAQSIAGASSPLRIGKDPGAPVELVLGIKRNGSSHLLLTDEQTRRFTHAMDLSLPRSRGYSVHDFESLSPIFFDNAEGLSKKLSFLKPKAKKSKGSSGQPSDTSQANRGYNIGTDNLYRGTFEHCRVIHRILENSIDPRIYGVEDVSWKHDIRISALVLNTRGIDHRPLAERIRNPVVLDVGFCDARLPSLLPDGSTAKHVIDPQNKTLGKRGTKKTFIYGESEMPPVGMMDQCIQELFRDHGRTTARPMILLVDKREQTVNYLQNMGVDVSRWRYDSVKELFRAENSKIQYTQYYQGDGMQSNSALRPSKDYQRRSRSRSRSPHRHSYRYNDKRAPPPSHRSRGSGSFNDPRPSGGPTRENRSYAPVYVVDVHELYTKLMQTQHVYGVVEIAHRLELTEEEEWWCAGNEAPLLIDIWRSMVSGPAIDEQRELRNGGLSQHAEPQRQTDMSMTPAPNSSSAPQPPQEDSDDENDPNDAPDARGPKQASSAPPRTDNYINFDESDYGSDSEESD